MAVQQTECYRVVTIGYLKSFIGSNIQNSSGAVVYVNTTNPDTYCPTYSELTGGSLIPNWASGTTPNGDRDGITVNPSAILGGTYASNQCVDQRDLGLIYTRFNSLSISLGKTSFGACGDSTSVSYIHNYTRYNKFMGDSCSVSTTSTTVGDTTCGELTWHPSLGSVANCNTYSIPKNSSSTGEAPARTGSVYSSVVFRTATKNSNTVSFSQAALTGSWLNNGTTYGVDAWPSTSQSFGCAGGSYAAYGTGYTYNTYIWKDACGTTYPSRASGTTATTALAAQSGSFAAWDCCNGAHSESASLSFSFQGKSTSVSFAMSCADCSSDPGCQPPPPPGPPAPDSFYPYYPDDNYTTEDGYVRGTDNGTDRCKDRNTGTWFEFVAPLVNDYHSGSDDDSIYVDSILYLNPSTGNWENFKTAGNVYLSSDVYVYYDSHLGSYGKGAIVAIFGANTSSDWRKLTLEMKTNDTSPISCGCNFDGRYANEWTWNFWQGPYGCSVSGKRERINPVPIGGDDPNYESHSGWSWADCD